MDQANQSQPQTGPQTQSRELDEQSIKRIVESLIFASDKPISLQQIKDIIGDVDTRVIRRLVNELKEEYAKSERSFSIVEVAGGYQFATDSAYGKWLKRLYNIKQSDYLTGPSLETLAIIAYKQPVTKADIEFIRGVNVDGVMNNLLEKGIIKVVGKKEVVGRPFLYGTTDVFLQYFGLNALQELPALTEFQEADLKFANQPPTIVDTSAAPDRGPEAADTGAGSVSTLGTPRPLNQRDPSSDNVQGEKDGDAKRVTQENRPD